MYPIENLFNTLDKFAKLIHEKKPYEKLYYGCNLGKDKAIYAAYAKYCYYEFSDSKRYEISTITFHGNANKIELTFGVERPSEIFFLRHDDRCSFRCNSKNWQIMNPEFDPILLNDMTDWLNLHIIMEI